MRIPSAFSTVTIVKSFRYVLYHSWNRIQWLTFFFGAPCCLGAGGAGFGDSGPPNPLGQANDRRGEVAARAGGGVRPSWIGEVGKRYVSMTSSFFPSSSLPVG